ncbi:MAG TPA: hypothetical protein VD999_05745 [Vitreimonas sp.]|nr:hypothetical protein [Vitreimonas sp.]
MLKVFADFHHASLLHSLIMVFEGRFGGELYRPIGIEWAEKGFWKVFDHPATQQQYLAIGGATPDGTKPLNEVESSEAWSNRIPSDHVYHCKDIDSGFTNKAITFDGFMSMPFDFVIASLPQHIEPFRKLCDLHPSKPKLIYQIGNQWNIEPHFAHMINGVMASAQVVHNYPVRTIQYHQEFDLKTFYPHKFEGTNEIPKEKTAYSFINVHQDMPDYSLFLSLEASRPDWNFKTYGGQCRDGSMDGSEQLANKMREAMFIWHVKAGGDGYGHVLYNAAAIGRPVIVKKSYYSGKLGEELLIDGKTCIDVDGLNLDQIWSKLDHYSQPEQYIAMNENVISNFKEKVNFDSDALKIKSFLDNLLEIY